MKDYQSMIPRDFPLAPEVGLIAAEQIDQAIGRGTTHFATQTYKHLLEVKDVLEEIGSKGSFISYHKSMSDSVGLHDFTNGYNALMPMPEEIRKQLGLEDEDES